MSSSAGSSYSGTTPCQSEQADSEPPWSSGDPESFPSILEQLGISGSDAVPADFSLCDLGFDIPNDLQRTEPPPEPAALSCGSKNETSSLHPRITESCVANQPVGMITQPRSHVTTLKSFVKVNLKPKIEPALEDLNVSDWRVLYMKQKAELKSKDQMITNMKKLIIEEQELRTAFRKKRDETQRELSHVKEELAKLTMVNAQLLRENENLRSSNASDKLLVQQLEAKVADLKYDNKRMTDLLKESGELEVTKMRDDLKEQKRLLRKYEKEIDEKTVTISNLRSNIEAAKTLSDTSRKSDKDKEIDDLKVIVTKLRSEMLNSVMALRKEMRGANPRTPSVKSSPDCMSETESELGMRSCRSSTYSNDDYGFYEDNFTPSSASSVASVSPPLSVACAFTVSGDSRSTSTRTKPSCSVPIVNVRPDETAVKKHGKPDATQKTVVAPDTILEALKNNLPESRKFSESKSSEHSCNDLKNLQSPKDSETMLDPVETRRTSGSEMPLPVSTALPSLLTLEDFATNSAPDAGNVPNLLQDNFVGQKQTSSRVTQPCSSEEVKVTTSTSPCVRKLENSPAHSVWSVHTNLVLKPSPKKRKLKSKKSVRSIFALSESDSDSGHDYKLDDLRSKGREHVEMEERPCSVTPKKLPPPKKAPSPGTKVRQGSLDAEMKLPVRQHYKSLDQPQLRKTMVASSLSGGSSEKATSKAMLSDSDSEDWLSSSESDAEVSLDSRFATKVGPKCDIQTQNVIETLPHCLPSLDSRTQIGEPTLVDSEEPQGPRREQSVVGPVVPVSTEASSPEQNLAVPLELVSTQALSQLSSPSFCLADDLNISTDDTASEDESTHSQKLLLVPEKVGTDDRYSGDQTLEALTTPSKQECSIPNEPDIHVESDREKLVKSPEDVTPILDRQKPVAPHHQQSRTQKSVGVIPLMTRVMVLPKRESNNSIPSRVPTLPSIFKRQASLDSIVDRRTPVSHAPEASKDVADVNRTDSYEPPGKKLRVSHCPESVILRANPQKPSGHTAVNAAAVPCFSGSDKAVSTFKKPSSKYSPAIQNPKVGLADQRLSARERIGRCVPEIMAVGSGENICDKKKLEIFARQTVERRKAEKQNSEPKVVSEMQQPLYAHPPCRNVMRQSPVRKLSAITSRTPGKAELNSDILTPLSSSEGPVDVSKNTQLEFVYASSGADNVTVCSPKKSPAKPTSPKTYGRKSAVPPPAVRTMATRRSSMSKEPPKRTMSTRRTPVKEPLKREAEVPVNALRHLGVPSSVEEIATPDLDHSVASPVCIASSGESTVLSSDPPVASRIPSGGPSNVDSSPASPCVEAPPAVCVQEMESGNTRSQTVRVLPSTSKPRSAKEKKPAQPLEKATFQKVLFGHYSRNLSVDEIRNQLGQLLAAGEEPMNPETFVKVVYADFCDSINYYLTQRINEHILIAGCEKTCANIDTLKSLLPDVYANIESKVVLYFGGEIISSPVRYSFQKNELLNQLAVCYGTICRHFDLRELGIRLLLDVLIARPPQKFTFAHGFVLAFPDLWSDPFELGSLLERTVLVGLVGGSLYTNSIYFQNVRSMIQDGVQIVLPSATYSASFNMILDEFKELDFESTILECARGLGMLVQQVNWIMGRNLILEALDKLFKEWQEKKVTDMIFAVFLNTMVWSSELIYDPSVGYEELLSKFIFIEKYLETTEPDLGSLLIRAVKDGIHKLSRLRQRGPRKDLQLVYYRVEDELEIRKQVSKATHSERKKQKRYKKREEIRKGKELMEELAQI